MDRRPAGTAMSGHGGPARGRAAGKVRPAPGAAQALEAALKASLKASLTAADRAALLEGREAIAKRTLERLARGRPARAVVAEAGHPAPLLAAWVERHVEREERATRAIRAEAGRAEHERIAREAALAAFGVGGGTGPGQQTGVNGMAQQGSLFGSLPGWTGDGTAKRERRGGTGRGAAGTVGVQGVLALE